MPFEDYITTGSIYRYNLICSIDAHDKIHPTENDDTSSGVARPLPDESFLDEILSLDLTLKFIESYIQSFKTNYLYRTTIYGESISELFLNILQKNDKSCCQI